MSKENAVEVEKADETVKDLQEKVETLNKTVEEYKHTIMVYEKRFSKLMNLFNDLFGKYIQE